MTTGLFSETVLCSLYDLYASCKKSIFAPSLVVAHSDWMPRGLVLFGYIGLLAEYVGLFSCTSFSCLGGGSIRNFTCCCQFREDAAGAHAVCVFIYHDVSGG